MSVLIPLKDSAGAAQVGVPINIYNDSLAVAASSTVTIVSYTVPALKKLLLDLVEFNGCNIAEYRVKIGAVIEAQKWTYFSGPLNGEFFYNGLEITTGTTILLEVENFRPSVADFHGRILGRLDDV